MEKRLQLHSKLLELLPHVYYQAPSTNRMTYPCIRYSLAKKDAKYANNARYMNTERYTVTIIDENPDSETPSKLEVFPLCQFDRTYASDDLNHWVYNLYF